jgi:hypothetical protein
VGPEQVLGRVLLVGEVVRDGGVGGVGGVAGVGAVLDVDPLDPLLACATLTVVIAGAA